MLSFDRIQGCLKRIQALSIENRAFLTNLSLTVLTFLAQAVSDFYRKQDSFEEYRALFIGFKALFTICTLTPLTSRSRSGTGTCCDVQ